MLCCTFSGWSEIDVQASVERTQMKKWIKKGILKMLRKLNHLCCISCMWNKHIKIQFINLLKNRYIQELKVERMREKESFKGKYRVQFNYYLRQWFEFLTFFTEQYRDLLQFLMPLYVNLTLHHLYLVSQKSTNSLIACTHVNNKWWT